MTHDPPPAIGGNRLQWIDLPLYLQQEISRLAGSPVVAWSSQPGGFSPGLASRLTLANGQGIFVKAISPEQTPEGPRLLRAESRVSKVLPDAASAPKFLWSHDDGTWVALGLEDINGHQPAQPWNEDELTRVLDALLLLSAEMTPSPIEVIDIVSSNADEFLTWRRWESATPDVDFDSIDPWILPSLQLLAQLESNWEQAASGTTLLHSDLRADNILLTDDRVVFVDWPGAQLGAAWVDPFLMLPSIAMHGTDVQRIVEEHPIFQDVDPDQMNAMLAAVAGYFVRSSTEPPPPGLPTVRAFQLAQGRAALQWLQQRVSYL